MSHVMKVREVVCA